MAAIEVGILRFREVYQGDMLDVTIDIEGIDLTGKTLKMQVRKTPTSEAVLTFEEDDAPSSGGLNSLTLTVNSITNSTVRFYKTAQEMADITPLSYNVRPSKKYALTVVMFTDDDDIEDTQTIIEGDMEVIEQITLIE